MTQKLRDEEIATVEFAKQNLVRPFLQWLTGFVIFCLFAVVLFAR